jgi:glycosyltransferase involved in cell wall biosynthesis
MRILTIVSDLGRGGTQQVAFNYAVGFKKAGHESGIFAYSNGGFREEHLFDEGIIIFKSNNRHDEILIAIEKIKKWFPDYIHIHRDGFYCNTTNLIIKSLRDSVKLIVETNVFARVDYSESSKLIDIHFQLSKWCLWKWKYLSSNLDPKPLGVIVPNSLIVDNFYKVDKESVLLFKEKFSIPASSFVFGRVGQPIESKWSRIVFDSFKVFAESNKNAYLVLVGCPEVYIQYVKTFDSSIFSRIVLIPFLENLSELRICFSCMDTFLHASSIGESFGMVLAEAQLCECPIITLSTPYKDNSQVEVVGPGGIVVFSKSEMLFAMNELYTNVKLRNTISLNGKNNIIENYSNDAVVKNILSIYSIYEISTSRQDLEKKLIESRFTITVPENYINNEVKNLPFFKKLFVKIILKIIYNPIIYKSYLIKKNV